MFSAPTASTSVPFSFSTIGTYIRNNRWKVALGVTAVLAIGVVAALCVFCPPVGIFLGGVAAATLNFAAFSTAGHVLLGGVGGLGLYAGAKKLKSMFDIKKNKVSPLNIPKEVLTVPPGPGESVNQELTSPQSLSPAELMTPVRVSDSLRIASSSDLKEEEEKRTKEEEKVEKKISCTGVKFFQLISWLRSRMEKISSAIEDASPPKAGLANDPIEKYKPVLLFLLDCHISPHFLSQPETYAEEVRERYKKFNRQFRYGTSKELGHAVLKTFKAAKIMWKIVSEKKKWENEEEVSVKTQLTAAMKKANPGSDKTLAEYVQKGIILFLSLTQEELEALSKEFSKTPWSLRATPAISKVTGGRPRSASVDSPMRVNLLTGAMPQTPLKQFERGVRRSLNWFTPNTGRAAGGSYQPT